MARYYPSAHKGNSPEEDIPFPFGYPTLAVKEVVKYNFEIGMHASHCGRGKVLRQEERQNSGTDP